MKKLMCILTVLVLLVAMPVFSAGSGEKAAEAETFKVLYFVGGMGELANGPVAKMKANNPNATIELEYNHKAQDVLRNSMMAGNPPDVFGINKGLYSHYGAIQDGLLGSMEFILDAPALDGKGTIRDRMVTSSLDALGYVDGVHYVLPDVSNLGGLWFDQKMMTKLGIDVDINWTWDEFMTAMGVVKKAGISPFAYYGQFAFEYPLNYFLMPMITSIDYDAFIDIQNLKEGAWKSPAVKTALNRLKDMVDKGYIWPPSVGAAGEVQMEFVKGNIGFYPCGSWLHAEMGDSWSDDFDLRFLPVPGKAKASGKNYVYTTDLISAIPSEVKNKELTIEYYQHYFTNDEVIEENIRKNQFIMPIVGFSEKFGHLLPSPVTDAVASLESADTMTSMLSVWYPEINKSIGNAINALVSGEIGIDEFGTRVEATTKRVREDSSINKYRY